MTEEEYIVRKAKVELRTTKILEEIKNLDNDILNNTSIKFDVLYKELDKIQEEIKDMINELEVDDFLEYGPGIE